MGVQALAVEGDWQRLVVRVQYLRRGGWNGDRAEPTSLELMVPLRATLEIDSVSANVDVSGVASQRLDVDSVSGSVVVVGAPARVEVDTVSGDIRLTVNSQDVSAETVSGSITLRGPMPGSISAEAVSGNIDVKVLGERVRKLSAKTVSGRIGLDTVLADGGRIELESVSGRLALSLPADVSARVRGTSMGGRLRAPGATIHKPRYGPGSSFDTRYGLGRGDIRMEILSGEVILQLE